MVASASCRWMPGSRGRHRMMYNGAAVATLVMDAAGALVTQPQVTVMGLIEGPEAGEILVEVGFAAESR